MRFKEQYYTQPIDLYPTSCTANMNIPILVLMNYTHTHIYSYKKIRTIAMIEATVSQHTVW